MPQRLALVGDHVCRWLKYDLSPLGADQVRFKTRYASGKYGTFAGVVDGTSFAGRRFDEGMRLFVEGDQPLCPPPSEKTPHGFGTAATGVVTEVGSAVTRWKAGDEIVAMSSDIREINTVGQHDVYAADGLDAVQSLCAEPAYVAFHAIRESSVRYGDAVVVVGLGALGLIAVRMARESGAQHVTAIDLSAGRRAMAKQYGADLVLDPRQGDAALAVHKALGGAGADVAIEISGSYTALETAIRCVRVAGTVCSAGFYQGDARGLWLGREWHHNRLEMVVPHGCGWGHPPRDFPRWDTRRAYEAIFTQMRRGQLDLPGLINPVVSPENATDLFRLCRDTPDKVIKFAVDFTGK